MSTAPVCADLLLGGCRLVSSVAERFVESLAASAVGFPEPGDGVEPARQLGKLSLPTRAHLRTGQSVALESISRESPLFAGRLSPGGQEEDLPDEKEDRNTNRRYARMFPVPAAGSCCESWAQQLPEPSTSPPAHN